MSTTTQTVAPPLVCIPEDVLYSNDGHVAYNDALDAADGVVVIPRGGRLEHIIDHRNAHEVLTDGKNFVFDKGVVKMMHMEFMMWFKNGTFVSELDGLVQTTVQSRLNAVVEKLGPLLREGFETNFTPAVSGGQEANVADSFEKIQEIVALAMVMLICGQQHVSARMIQHFVGVTNATARLSGFFYHVDGWPMWARGFYPFWSTTVSLLAIIPHLVFGILPELWRTRHAHLENARNTKPVEFTPLFDHLLAHHWSEKQGAIEGFGNFMWCAVASVGIIFASIHQTVVVAMWVVVEMARHQDVYLEKIREEWTTHVARSGNGDPKFAIRDLNKLIHLDSFIREVMRTKGDAFGPVRFSTRPVRVGGYVLPANAICLPYVRRAHGHPDNYGSSGDVFDGFRWVDTGRPAVQGSEGFLSFGLGRWACPGRHLAVAEIKILTYLLFETFDVKLDETTFAVLDPMNTTSVPPKATLQMRKRSM